jgi:hypothetical protein
MNLAPLCPFHRAPLSTLKNQPTTEGTHDSPCTFYGNLLVDALFSTEQLVRLIECLMPVTLGMVQ